MFRGPLGKNDPDISLSDFGNWGRGVERALVLRYVREPLRARSTFDGVAFWASFLVLASSKETEGRPSFSSGTYAVSGRFGEGPSTDSKGSRNRTGAEAGVAGVAGVTGLAGISSLGLRLFLIDVARTSTGAATVPGAIIRRSLYSLDVGAVESLRTSRSGNPSIVEAR